ncbi:hypothetical protein QJQ45_002588 [Haematococcus lacustris]|nr:hypothetical protein QJQ45_002588 [Haematococcus lacustris]
MWPVKAACQSADCDCLQVIKVPGGAVLRGCKETKRKLLAHLQLRAEGLMWCPIVTPRKPPHAPLSSQEATSAAASGPSTPPPAKRSKRTKAEQVAELSQGKAAKAKPAPQRGRWLDRDCNAALNMQRIWESRWRPLELC